ncbi:putative aldouronate transport system substrate-binding protein [Cohnella sp. OV330]|uniref:extracellular solute-binding protein n=1 Tax=Cohnella sp. OV330 TaxID=1855288 RepID=UPI0008E411F2|nr:extracellular solute-binding protein [Cohnella sp. OV330]SFA75036.1 putative aldouronate transport system substrate-binding protein [Cohnella sp. OV330]
MVKRMKWLAAGLSVIQVGLIVSACGNANNNDSPSSAAASGSAGASASASASGEKMKLMVWNFDADKTNLNGYAMNAIREKLGVDLDFYTSTNDPDAIREKLLLQIASGDIPDWWKEVPFADADKFADQGAAAEIPLELLEKNAPNYMKWMEKNLGPDPMRYVRRPDGKIYSLPVLWTLASSSEVLGYRKDWLEKVGIAKTPETIDEMGEALTKFRNDDPDGNGKKDTYGMTAVTTSGQGPSIAAIFSPVFGAYGVYPGATVDMDGKAVRGEVEPGAKEALTTLNKWFKSELIDPEFFVNKDTNLDDKVISSKVGVVARSWWEFIQPEAFFSGKYYVKLREQVPNAEWALSSGPKGPDGKSGITEGNPMLGTGIQFGIQLEKDQAKMAKYLQMFDATSFDMDLFTKIKYGKEGVTYEHKADGSYVYLPPYDKEEERTKFGIGPYYHAPASFNDYDFQAPFMTRKDLMPVKEEAASKGIGKYDFMTPLNKPVYTEFKDALDQMTIKNYINFITGRRPIGEFDAFVAEWKKAGGEQVLAEAQAKLDELNKK